MQLLPRVGFESMTCWSQVQHSTHCATASPEMKHFPSRALQILTKLHTQSQLLNRSLRELTKSTVILCLWTAFPTSYSNKQTNKRTKNHTHYHNALLTAYTTFNLTAVHFWSHYTMGSIPQKDILSNNWSSFIWGWGGWQIPSCQPTNSIRYRMKLEARILTTTNHPLQGCQPFKTRNREFSGSENGEK